MFQQSVTCNVAGRQVLVCSSAELGSKKTSKSRLGSPSACRDQEYAALGPKMASQDVPVILYGERGKSDIPALVERGIRTGHLNLANLGLNALPDEIFKIVPVGEPIISPAKRKAHLKPKKTCGDYKDETESDDSEAYLDDEDSARESPTRKVDVLITSNTDSSTLSGKFFDISSVVLEPREEIKIITRLTLSSNQFICIPGVICKMTNLRMLDVQDNKMTVLPKEIGKLQSLLRLVISHNFLVDLNPEVYTLKNLRCLLAQDNKMVMLNDDLKNFRLMEIMDFSQNLLLEIPSSIIHLRRLETLNLSSNQLVSLPTEIGKLQALRVVDVSDNQLTHLPSSIGELRLLEQLGARRNRITVFPRLHYSASLKELHLGGNQIRTIDRDALISLGSLAILELRDNSLKSLPPEIQQLSSLVRLDLINNELNNLPYSLGNIRTLKALYLEGNPLECITKKTFLHSGTEEVLQYLRDRMEEDTLEKDVGHSAGEGNTPMKPSTESSDSASSRGLMEKEKQIMSVTKFLDYSNRQADEIPDEVLSIALECRVHTVKLSRNYFITIPTRLKDFLHLLIELDLSYNRLCELPSFIGYSPHLQVLDIQDNQLNSLPEEIVNLKQLQKLNISHNKFYVLPEVLYSMPWLEMLFAANNQINNLDPEGLIQMKNLKVLDLVNNDIKHLPPQLGLLEQLRRLQLFGNPFRQPRATIINRGTASVLEWLRDRLPTTTIESSFF